MTKSAKGSKEKPGKHVRQKAGLDRGILETGWAGLHQMPEYRAANVIAADPARTSQTCSVCGAVDRRSRRSQSEFHCVACGHSANADLNAAANILASGTGTSARGGGSGRIASGWPVKRETDAWEAA